MTARTICNEPGCPELVDAALERCTEHRIERTSNPALDAAERSLIQVFDEASQAVGNRETSQSEEILAIGGDISLLADRVFAIRKMLGRALGPVR